MKIREILKLLRVINDAMVGGAVVLSQIVALRSLPDISTALLGFATGFFLSAAAMVSNDIADLEVDAVNAPHRPLVQGSVSIKEAWLVFALCSIAGITSSVLLGPLCCMLAAAALLTSVLYNFKVKAYGLVGNAFVSFNVALPFLFGEISLGTSSLELTLNKLFFVMAFFANMSREVVKDVADVEGDRRRGLKTLPIALGQERALVVALVLMLIAVAGSILPFLLGLAGVLYLALVATADAVFVSSALRVLRRPSKNEALKCKQRFLVGMLFALLAFVSSIV